MPTPDRSTPQATAASVLRDSKPLRLLIWLLIIAATLAIFREAETVVSHVFSVVILFVFASVIALMLTPVVDLVQRIPLFKNHRAPAALLLYALVLAAVIALAFALAPTLIEQARHTPELIARAQDQLNKWGIPLNLDALSKSAYGFDVNSSLGLVGGVVGTLASIVLVIVISMYLLIEGRAVIATWRKLLPAHEEKYDFIVLAVGSTVGAYVRGQIIMSTITGVYIGGAMALLGVRYAIVLGLVAAVLEFVPIVGAIVAMVIAIAVALLQSPQLAIWAFLVGVVGHALEAYVVGPRVTGRVTQTHPLVAMTALLVGAEVGGVLGALFGVPIAAAANIVLGAVYRAQQGDEPLTTDSRGKLDVDSLPRLGDEIGGIEESGVVSDPVPRERNGPATAKK